MYNLDFIVSDIIQEYNLPIKIDSLLFEDLLKSLLIGGSIKEAANLLDISDSKLEHIIDRKVLTILPKPGRFKWDNYLLGLVYLKKCYKCKNILELDCYGISDTLHYGLSRVCLACDSTRSKDYYINNRNTCQERSNLHYINNKTDYLARNANRRALKLKATPSWANLDIIKLVYEYAEGDHVDHIIPLQGELVCGLHVESNLQYLTALENKQKSNKFNAD